MDGEPSGNQEGLNPKEKSARLLAGLGGGLNAIAEGQRRPFEESTVTVASLLASMESAWQGVEKVVASDRPEKEGVLDGLLQQMYRELMVLRVNTMAVENWDIPEPDKVRVITQYIKDAGVIAKLLAFAVEKTGTQL